MSIRAVLLDMVDTLAYFPPVGIREEGIRIAAEAGIAELFDELVISADEGVAKPEAAIYLAATGRLEVEPKECVFIGDGANNELAGARALGIRAVRIEREKLSDEGARDDCFDARVKSLSEFMSWLEYEK